MDFLKTKSSYVKRKKHSETKDGTIFERDITTLGGLNSLSSTQYPIYTSGNFIISVDNTIPAKRKINTQSWVNNGDSDIWSLDTLSANSSSFYDETSDETFISFNKDFYDLQNFSYYGSLNDFINKSFAHIVNTFPGELYVPYDFDNNNIGYNVQFTIKAKEELAVYILGLQDASGKTITDEYIYNILNPFDLNLHVHNPKEDLTNTDRFFWYGTNKNNYTIIDSGGTSYDVEDLNVVYTPSPKISGAIKQDNVLICKGDYTCQVDFLKKDGTELLSLRAYIGDYDNIFYLTKQKFLNVHLRPKEELYENFIDNLSLFEAYILSYKESPLSDYASYVSYFNVITEEYNGYRKSIEKFVVPIDRGGYNIDINSATYLGTISRLSKIASFYDEHFTDNLYRSMTHESIKNFDWTYTREYQDGDEADYVIGGNKMSNILHLFAREFDEIKGYIDNIKYVNVLTYDNKNNLSNYFLSDAASLKGWDVTNIYPYTLNKIENNIHCIFSSDSDKDYSISPYTPSLCIPYGSFVYCDCNGIMKEEKNNDANTLFQHTDCASFERIMPYYSKKEYSLRDVNNEFIKRLILNSSAIFKHKGTIEGVEELLGMFGLKSKRWVNSLNVEQGKTVCSGDNIHKEPYYTADYEINEYTTFTKGLFDYYNSDTDSTWINYYCRTRSTYNDTFDDNEEEYESLPVRSYKKYNYNGTIIDEATYHNMKTSEQNKCSYIGSDIYPFFYDSIEGNPYYQMNGGWMIKDNFSFDKEDNIVQEGNSEEDITSRILYTETYASMNAVDDISEVKDFIPSGMSKGDILYVRKMNNEYVVVDGFDFYKLEKEKLLIDNSYYTYRYFTYTATPVSTSIGEMTFNNQLTVSNPQAENGEETYDISNISSNLDIKIYINDDLTFTMTDGSAELIDTHVDYFLKYGDMYHFSSNSSSKTYTKYFILHEGDNCHYFDNEYGWEQLTDDDTRYLRVNMIVDKYNGNNPHIGNFNYDMGYEYIDYFNYLFKHALEYSLFNEDCFDEAFGLHENVLKNIGFKTLLKKPSDNENYSKIGYYEEKDDKVHSFCDIISNNINSSNAEPTPPNIYMKNVYGNLGGNLTKQKFGTNYNIKDVSRLSNDSTAKYGLYDDKTSIPINNTVTNIYGNNIISGLNITNITDQIVNLKRMDIIFFMHNTEKYSKQALEEKKYIDSVILPYLEQVLPTNIICKICYQY